VNKGFNIKNNHKMKGHPISDYNTRSQRQMITQIATPEDNSDGNPDDNSDNTYHDNSDDNPDENPYDNSDNT
jgi:hypothetical protein